jgi:deoxyribodipyrimidine photolyase
MPAKKKRSKQRSTMRGTNRIMTGLSIDWRENAESAEIMAGAITHANITHSNHNYRQVCKHVWLKYGPKVYDTLQLTWRIHITAIFTNDDGHTVEEEHETVAHVTLAQMAIEVQPWVDRILTLQQEISLESNQPYRLTEYVWRVECLGNRPVKPQDYELTA